MLIKSRILQEVERSILNVKAHQHSKIAYAQNCLKVCETYIMALSTILQHIFSQMMTFG